MSVKILCDSTADFEMSEIEAMNLLYVPLPVILNGKTYYDGIDLTKSDFYKLMAESNDFPSTSQPSPSDFLNFFKEAKENDDELVVLTISSALSGTYQNAELAKSMSGYDKIYIVDSLCLVAALRIMVEKAVAMRDDGYSAKEIADTMKDLSRRTRIFAGLDTLENLYKGGRLTKAQAGIGEFAGIKPVVTVNREGSVEITGKVIGKCKACTTIIKQFEKNERDKDYPVYFVYSGNDTNEKLLRSKICAGGYDFDSNPSYNLGPTIATHIGEGAFGICYISKE